MGSASDWLKQIFLPARPVKSSSQVWVVACHQYGISAVVPLHYSASNIKDGHVQVLNSIVDSFMVHMRI